MIERPRLKPHLHAQVVPGEGAVILSENGHTIHTGRQFELVLPHVEGKLTVEEIVAALQDQVPAGEVRQTLSELDEHSYLTGRNGTDPAGEAVMWALQEIDPKTAADCLVGFAVTLRTVGGLSVEPLATALESVGIRIAEPGGLGVVLTDDYLRPELEAFNQEALKGDTPWMLVKPIGREIWIGPIIRPEQTGCWECLAQRLRANRGIETVLRLKAQQRDRLPVPLGFTAASQQIAWNMAAMQIALWVAREGSEMEGRIVTLDLLTWSMRSHSLVWRPQCPACGDAPAELGELDLPSIPVVLTSRSKQFTKDNGHRVMAPEATLERFGHHVSPITGAVSRLDRHGPADGALHAYGASHNAALPRTLAAMRQGLRSKSGGKGTTDIQAKASALCEALERHSAQYQGNEPRRMARLRELGGAAIHPNDCMLISERQYADRAAWNARGSKFNRICEPFDEKAEIGWTPVWSMTRQAGRYLPTAYCYFQHPDPQEARHVLACSNGNAAGNTLEEAILQGFLELVERDGVALWWYSRVQQPGVDLDSFEEPYLVQLHSYLQSRDRDLWVLDLTSDLEIPTFVSLSRWLTGPSEMIAMGFGAHLDARVAVLRAVTEMNQCLLRLTHLRDNAPTELNGDLDVREWFSTATLAGQPYLGPDPAARVRTAADFPRLWSDDLREDVQFCQRTVERHGMEMLVLDQTRPDIGLPVVKVFVPGLRHFWARFAPGRLYDVPVKLGWLSQPLAEEDLNPIRMFM